MSKNKTTNPAEQISFWYQYSKGGTKATLPLLPTIFMVVVAPLYYAVVSGKLGFGKESASALDVVLPGLLLLIILGLLFIALAYVQYDFSLPGINANTFKWAPEARFDLAIFKALNELRGYVLAIWVVWLPLGICMIMTGNFIPGRVLIISAIFGVVVLSKMCSQNEYWVKFLSPRYIRLLATCYYSKKHKDIYQKLNAILGDSNE